MQAKATQILTQNTKLCKEIEELKADKKSLSKKLFKIASDGDVITLDPYEMHKKIRLYESTIEVM